MSNSVLYSLLLQAQESHLLFQSDKVWAVLIVMLIIWGGVLLLLFRLDRRLSQLEKEIQSES